MFKVYSELRRKAFADDVTLQTKGPGRELGKPVKDVLAELGKQMRSLGLYDGGK